MLFTSILPYWVKVKFFSLKYKPLKKFISLWRLRNKLLWCFEGTLFKKYNKGCRGYVETVPDAKSVAWVSHTFTLRSPSRTPVTGIFFFKFCETVVSLWSVVDVECVNLTHGRKENHPLMHNFAFIILALKYLPLFLLFPVWRYGDV